MERTAEALPKVALDLGDQKKNIGMTVKMNKCYEEETVS